MINKIYLLFLTDFISFVCVSSHNFEPVDLKDVKELQFKKNEQTVGFYPKPQLACFNEQDELCLTYELNQVTCRRKNVNKEDYLDILKWDCTALISSYVEFDERNIKCEQYPADDNQPVAAQTVIKDSCFFRYSLKREPKLTDFDSYLFAKAAGYLCFSLMFFIICCIVAQKNKRTRAQRARFVNVYCVTNADNELVIAYPINSTTIEAQPTRNEPEEDDLPPAYSTLFN